MSRFAFNPVGRLLAMVTFLAVVAMPSASAQSASLSFDPTLSGNVYAMARQPDGKLLVAGGFTSVNSNEVGEPWDRGRMARINPDGSLDPTFWAEFNNDVTNVLLLPDGKMLVAGKFTTVRSLVDLVTPIARNGLARLLPDGRLDLTFDPNPLDNSTTQGLVRAMVLQPDGRIVIGGGFTSLWPSGAPAKVGRNHLARLNADGSVDPTFDPNANNVVLALALEAGGQILAGGGFTTLQPNGAPAPTPMARLARLNGDGTIDTALAVEPDNRVLALKIEADGSILVGGDFLRVRLGGGGSAITAPHLFRVDATGDFDEAFDVIPNGTVDSIALQADGRILIGGSFLTHFSRENKGTFTRGYLARLNRDGSLDFTLGTSPSAPVRAFVVEPDGSIVIGGLFTRLQGGSGTGVLLRRRIARVQPNGAIDSAFSVTNGGNINDAVRLPDGSTIYAGSFRAYGGITRSGIVHVSVDGQVDLGYAPEFSDEISDIELQPDGKLLVGGFFTRIGSVARQFLARLNADGSVDTGFDPRPNSNITDITLQENGMILVAGSFTTLTPNGAGDPISRTFIARLNSDGTVESGFNPSAGNLVNSVVVQPDGKMLIGGFFTSLRPNQTGNAIARSYLARLNADGTVDTAFNVSINNTVSVIAVQSDGKILIGGSFTAVASTGATEVFTRTGIARLNPDGAVDTGFDPSPDAPVTDLAVLSDGRIAIGGSFAALKPNGAENSVSRRNFAWLETDGTSSAGRAYGFNGAISMVSSQPDGLIVAGGFDRIFVPPASNGLAAPGQIVRFTLEGGLDDTFTIGSGLSAGDRVSAAALQSDGRIVLGGSFGGLNGSQNRNLMRLDAAGSPDSNFFAKPDAPVDTVAIMPPSSDFVAAGGPVGWLTAEGTLLPSFDPTSASTMSGAVTAIARQSDGRLLVGGSIGNSFGTGSNLVRFNADGSVDTSFAPSPNSNVRAIAVQGDGKIIVGGNFTTMGGVARERIARLNADGTLDTAFDLRANGTVVTIQVFGSGKILIGGLFTTLQPSGAESATSRTYLAQLNSDGTLDTAFNASVNGAVNVVTLQSDAKILIGGNFTAIGGTTRTYMARLNEDGSLDASFTGLANNTVLDIAVESDGRILVGGNFTGIQDNASASVVSHAYLARLTSTGALETSFAPSPSAAVNVIKLQSDGRILVAGSFSFFRPDLNADPFFHAGLARLNADGSIDAGFNPIPDGAISAIAVFSDGTFAVGGNHSLLVPEASMLVGGEFTNFSETPVTYLARLFNNGLVDVTLPAVPNGAVRALAMEPDRSIIVAGAFTEISGTERLRLARLSPAGELDETFNPAADGEVRAAVVLPDGRIVVGGDFTAIAGGAAQRLAMLTATGALAGTFNASVDDSIDAILPLADGSIVIAGAFTTVNGTPRPRLARLDSDGSLVGTFNPAPDGVVSALSLQGDGRIIVGGAFTQIGGAARRGVARLNADGTVDGSFVADTNGDVLALALQFNGSLVVGGSFTEIAGDRRRMVARLSSTTLSSQVVSVDAGLDAATLSIGGASRDVASTQFSFSPDAETWTDLGAGQRTGNPGEWRVTGLSLPASSIYYLRVEGLTATSRFGSGGPFTTEAQFFGAAPAVSFALPGRSGGNGGTSGDGDDPSNPPGSNGGSNDGGTTGGGSSGGGSGDSSSDVKLPRPGSGDSAMFGVINLSGRGYPLATEPLITGFVVAGDGPQHVLLRAVGPGLGSFGVNDALEEPVLRIFDSAGHLVQETTAWGGDATVAAAAAAVGAFALDLAGSDSATVATLDPGVYTAHLFDKGGLGGVALGEIYLVAGSNSIGTLANVSLRGPVGAGDSILVAGFAVDSDLSQAILVRGVGPALAAFGVADPTSDPLLQVFDSSGGLIAANDDWMAQTGGSASAVAAVMASVNAFSLPPGSRDSALLLILPKGNYTIQLSARDLGSALIEVYAVP